MSDNGRVFNDVLKPLVERFHTGAKALSEMPLDEEFRTVRAWHLGRLDELERIGDQLADAIGVARPQWEAMREIVPGGGR